MKKLHITVALAMLLSLACIVGARIQENQTQTDKSQVTVLKTTVSPVAPKKPVEEFVELPKITKYILSVNKMDESAAKHMALVMCRAAKKFGISPYLVAATAKVESDYSMHSRPCIGIMQISHGEGREAKRVLGLDVYKPDDNIYIGAWCLAKYGKEMNRRASRSFKPMASRGGFDRSAYTRRALGRYNGCGPNGSYVSKVLKVGDHIVNPKTKKPKTRKKH